MKSIWLVGVFCGAVVLAQDAPKVDPALRAEVLHLLKSMHVDDLMRQQLKSTLPPIIKMMKQNPAVSAQLADEFAKEFEAQILASSELTDMVVDAYASHFSLPEIKDLEAFYNSPTGRKMVDAQPELMTDVSKRAGAFGQKLAMDLMSKIVKEHPEYLKKDPPPPPVH